MVPNRLLQTLKHYMFSIFINHVLFHEIIGNKEIVFLIFISFLFFVSIRILFDCRQHSMKSNYAIYFTYDFVFLFLFLIILKSY